MIPIAAILLVVAIAHLMASSRLPALDPVRTHWRRVSPVLASWMRRAPATYTYLLILLVTTWVLETSSSTVARELLLSRSTNLHHLATDPVHVLVASAFFVSSAGEWVVWVVMFSLVAAAVEHRLGSGRAVTVFAIGHIGATLLTAAGLWLALRADLVESSVTREVDVGASYGFVAVAGLFAYLLPRRRRLVYLSGLFAVLIVLLAVERTFTDVGHLVAASLGLACLPLVPASARPRG